ncbi:hypothetical protein L910_2868 [Vibrio fluvialis PG41]|uniref:Uncharacterized protein n=1 Tax=Vibrio fluvialis PG41 TaxID=1336752 RepID=S7J751_VIBFL|nr:hypothetical protein L910_2868 [Vibrio fluvialis PG41]
MIFSITIQSPLAHPAPIKGMPIFLPSKSLLICSNAFLIAL